MTTDYPFTEELCFLNFRIRWHTDSPVLLDILKEQFLYDQELECKEFRDVFDFYVAMIPDSDGDASWNTALKHHYDPGSKTLQLSYLDGAIRVSLDYAQKRVEARIMERALAYRAALGNWVLTIPLSELLKIHDYFLMHAACLVREGQGILFAGRSGVGKTTLSIALLSMGWEMVSDDEVFLRREPDGQIIAFGGPERAKVSWHTWRRFSYYLGEQSRFNGKRIVQLGDYFPDQIHSHYPVHTLCFTQRDERLALSELTSMEAYRRLLSVAFLTTEPRLTRNNSDFIYELSQTLPAYSLRTSLDIKALDRLLEQDILK